MRLYSLRVHARPSGCGDDSGTMGQEFSFAIASVHEYTRLARVCSDSFSHTRDQSDYSPNNFRTRFSTLSFSGSYG